MTEPLRTDLDPEAVAVVADIRSAGVPEWSALSVESARRVEDEAFSGDDPPAVGFVRDVAIPGPEQEIPLRVYRNEGLGDADSAPVLVYYHGGGWVLGTLDSIDGVCRRLARRGDCVVVSVDYRLAPEHPFPSAVDDAFTALRWVADNAEDFGGDPNRLAVGGTSAGGNLAAVTAIRARNAAESRQTARLGGLGDDAPEIARQVLCYPITDHAFDTDSYAENADGPLLTEDDMRWFWDHYLRSEVDGANPYASPLRARDLAGLPPATVVTCGHDPLRDEGVAYAERLAESGVAVRHDHHPDQPHGFLSMSESISAADRVFDELGEELQHL
ncbi:alpha/beta hydrolase [Halorussus lipolyticus]|uniref:alpha/beta hydrolase n=1 Tax=Halorussus lipolyticus TaxID=3034024 RepID=UPI0023E7B819|nr:alpha/beta hydrolase [Halorussus sp. DT80]